VGARKCGTTSLYFYLKRIPGIYMSPIKELFYFAPHAVQTDAFDVIRDKKEYLRLFEKAEDILLLAKRPPVTFGIRMRPS
jgi:hypothetical protein